MDAEVPIEPASGRRADPELRSLVETLPDTPWLCDPNSAQAVSTLGYFHPSLSRGLAIVGDAAAAWWQRSDPATRTRCFGTLAKAGLHSLLLTPGAVIDTADSALRHFSLASTPLPAHQAVARLRQALEALRAPRVTVHGVLLNVFGLGVLLTGESGIGKSELALELLSRGHRLVADDAVELRRLPGPVLEGRSPSLLNGMLEVRGLGILDARSMYGTVAIRDTVGIDLALHLKRTSTTDPEAYLQRLQGQRGSRAWLDIDIPQITMPVTIGHNLATLVEAACRDFWLRLYGQRADLEFAERQQAAINRPRTQ